jgi:glucose-6-phosphate dehydrogenase assembly protein OpcA
MQTPMSNIAAKLRAHRAETRTRRALSRAIDTASSATVRQELVAIAQARHTHMR